MKSRLFSSLSALAAAALAIAALFAQGYRVPNGTLMPNDPQLRAAAINPDLPAYPAVAVRARAHGVAVARIFVSSAGEVTRVEILQAPDAAIRAALRSALLKWRFHPIVIPLNGPRPMIGKLIYYFELSGGRPRVLSPAQAPVIGPKVGHKAAHSSPAAGPPVSPAELSRLSREGASVLLLDTRSRASYASAHVAGAVNIPLDELVARAPHELAPRPTTVFFCADQGECDLTAMDLGLLGYASARFARGDYSAFGRAGVKVVRSATRG